MALAGVAYSLYRFNVGAPALIEVLALKTLGYTTIDVIALIIGVVIGWINTVLFGFRSFAPGTLHNSA